MVDTKKISFRQATKQGNNYYSFTQHTSGKEDFHPSKEGCHSTMKGEPKGKITTETECLHISKSNRRFCLDCITTSCYIRHI